MPVSSWFTSASLNTSVGGVAIGEGAARANMNDMGRAIMAEAKTKFDDLDKATPLTMTSYLPSDAVRAAVAARTYTTNVSTYMDTAATAAVAAGRPLHFPSGTYPLLTWLPPANLTVTTDGETTVFKQLDTSAVTTRMIHITTDNVALWPGGSATLDGSIDTISGNATEQNHGIYVDSPTTAINRFTVGDVYGKNIGGDVVLIRAYSTGTIGHCAIGTVYGRNIYRNIVSITGGTTGTITAVVQHPGAGLGCGLGALFFEPDPDSALIKKWTVGLVVGRTISIVGDPDVRLGDINIGELHLDYSAYGVSTPVFNTGGINVGTNPDQFLHGIRCRNFRNLHIGRFYVKGHTRSAIFDLGSNAGDDQCDSFQIDTMAIDGTCTDYPTYAQGDIVLQKHRKVTIGSLVYVSKISAANPTLTAGATDLLEINGGEIPGRFCNQTSGAITLRDVKQTSLGAENIFRNVTGKLRIIGGSGSGNPTVMFEACTVAPVMEDWTGGTLPISGVTPNVYLSRVTTNSIYYDNAWLNASAAVASAATITLPKTGGDVISITGTVTITGITADAGNAGRRATLVFSGALTFTDGTGSLRLAGNFVTTDEDTITISTRDGTTWYEIGRSVN